MTRAAASKSTIIRLSAVLTLLFAASGWAQSVVNFQNNWTNTGNPPGVFITNAMSDTGNGNAFIGTSGGANLAAVLGLSGAALDDGDAVADSFTFSIRTTQAFSLNAQALVTIPTFAFGSLTFPAGVAGTSSVTWNVSVLDNTLAATGLAVNQNVNANAVGGNQNVNAFHNPGMNLAAGNYTIQATFTLTGNANPALAGAAGSSVNDDFISGTRRAMVTSFSAVPTAGIGDSRDAVRAPQARAAFGVTGAGIKIGQVEPGDPYTTHTSLAGRVNVIVGGAGVPAGSDGTSDEHALAVAGIMASAGANNSQAGIAPGASVTSAGISTQNGASASAKFQNSVNALVAAGARVINMSATTNTAADTTFIDGLINTNPNLVFVKSSGNSEPAGANSVTPPGMSYNGITVGALNKDFTQRASFSSFSHGTNPIKPDIVAPGEYIVAPNSIDTNNDGMVNDFSRGFLGEDYHNLGATTGDITGTSFSAPHVSGAVALMQQYQALHAADHDADHRVLKAVMLNQAHTNVQHNGGGAWAQGTTGSPAGQNLVVNRSLDTELGAGALDVYDTLGLYSQKEAKASDNNTAQHSTITPDTALWWDLENVAGTNAGQNGTVDYLLPESLAGQKIRATLTFDIAGAVLPNLELRLYHEGANDFNVLGFDQNNPLDDILIAQTFSAAENVKLFDFVVPNIGPGENMGYYLEVINLSNAATTYGLAFVPEPATVVILLTICLFVIAHRPAARRLLRAA